VTADSPNEDRAATYAALPPRSQIDERSSDRRSAYMRATRPPEVAEMRALLRQVPARWLQWRRPCVRLDSTRPDGVKLGIHAKAAFAILSTEENPPENYGRHDCQLRDRSCECPLNGASRRAKEVPKLAELAMIYRDMYSALGSVTYMGRDWTAWIVLYWLVTAGSKPL